jgi:Peptidase family M23
LYLNNVKLILKLICILFILFFSSFYLFSEDTSELFSLQDEVYQLDNEYSVQTLNSFFNDSKGFYAKFSNSMIGFMSGEDFALTREQIINSIGQDFKILNKQSKSLNGLRQILLQLQMTSSGILLDYTVWINSEDLIEGFRFVPSTEAPYSKYSSYKTKTDLILPFLDKWYVLWGGRTVVENYHAVHPGQQFASDFLIARNNYTYKGDPLDNRSYFCYEEPVYAPGNGTVTVCEKNIPDNVPGVMNPDQPLGNYVILDHGNGEFSFLAHFKTESIVVTEGQRVVMGEFLGLCGNSGNSSEAHLHYHMQSSADFSDGLGLPAQFQDYYADGQIVDISEPSQQQKIYRE